MSDGYQNAEMARMDQIYPYHTMSTSPKASFLCTSKNLHTSVFLLSCHTRGIESVSKSTVQFGNINEYTKQVNIKNSCLLEPAYLRKIPRCNE